MNFAAWKYRSLNGPGISPGKFRDGACAERFSSEQKGRIAEKKRHLKVAPEVFGESQYASPYRWHHNLMVVSPEARLKT